MTAGYLDTNILIAYFGGDVMARKALERFSPLRLPAIAYAEFLSGLKDERERSTLDEILHKLFEIVQTDTAICREAAHLRRESRLKLMDALIYATARAGGGSLITRDKDFDKSWPDVYIPDYG